MDTFISVFLLTIIGVISIILYMIARKGNQRKIGELQRPILDLLKRGFNSGTLVIQNPKTGYFVQFSKYILGKNDYGITFDFPRVSWSEQYFTQLIDLCETEEIIYDIETAQNNLEIEFISIDFRKDVDKAYEFTTLVLSDVFNADVGEEYKVMLNNAHPEEVLIDR